MASFRRRPLAVPEYQVSIRSALRIGGVKCTKSTIVNLWRPEAPGAAVCAVAHRHPLQLLDRLLPQGVCACSCYSTTVRVLLQ
jgi:hypothetical protein